jgi:hypothetical protein
MEAVMEDIVYTKKDLKALAAMCNPGSSLPIDLEEMKYDPNKFKDYLFKNRQFKQYHFIYKVSLEDAFMEINNPSIQRLFAWRTSISK